MFAPVPQTPEEWAAWEQHRHECEARYALRMPREERLRYYDGVARRRGREKARALTEEVNRQYRLQLEQERAGRAAGHERLAALRGSLR